MKKILIIDDNPMVRKTLSMILRNSGFSVSLAENGKEGLAAFRAGGADLVITDIIMPEKEGIETIMDIRRDDPEAKIIAISGGARSGHADFLHMAKSFGAMAVIGKPFGPNEMIDCIRSCLGA